MIVSSQKLPSLREGIYFEFFKVRHKEKGVSSAQRRLVRGRLRAIEKLRERRKCLRLALAAESDLPVKYDNPGVLDFSVIEVIRTGF